VHPPSRCQVIDLILAKSTTSWSTGKLPYWQDLVCLD
jgi:hypothetical protein